ncbi:apolipoprotein L3-like [Sorex fumeus]|uniref:apolipoprotein L3-like n=1 Tax=Sorex fumeus TaxID=62283 RepID=UPI0024AD2677|nr:apolipoprotein L3-like [Sorex fumeus]
MSSERIIEDTINSLLNEVNKEDLHLLFSKDEEWEQFVADAELTRDEAKAVREGLKKHGKLTVAEIKKMGQREKEFREKFLKLYSRAKKEAEESIKQLHALAEKADEVHKNCTIANVVADSTGIVSGILCIAGIGLAPFTGGLSLAVSGAGLVTGSAATVTAVATSIVEHSYMSSIEAEVKKLESTEDNLRLLWEILESFIDYTIHSLLNEVSEEDLQSLLSRDDEWEQLVADSELSRDEAKALRESLRKQGTLTDAEIKEMHQQEKEFRERFLNLYPQVKSDVEKHINQLHILAEKADRFHKNRATAYKVAKHTGLASSLLNSLGMILSPFTSVPSFTLTGVGLVLGYVAVATTVVSKTQDRKNVLSIEAEAKNLESTGVNLGLLWEVLGDSKERISSLVNCYKVVRHIARHVCVMKLASISPEATAQSSSLNSKVLGATTKTKTKEVSIIGRAFSGLAILMDIYGLEQDSKELQERAKTESGEMLKQRAQEMENMLVELQQVYETLQSDLIPSEERREQGGGSE